MKRFLVTIALVFGLSFMALAAEDANGTWKATLTTPNGAMTNTFVLKIDGDKVTGSISSDMMVQLQQYHHG